jgi:DNA mismatch repair protein MutS
MSEKLTPLMQQYFRMKQKYPDAIMLYRVGDFYETFGEDAVKTSKALGIVLTARNNGGNDMELAGFPFHALDNYLPKLIKNGYRVAICEQLEKPNPQSKLVRRGVTEIITPGIALDDRLLDHKRNNFLASIDYVSDLIIGLALFDISTGEFFSTEGDFQFIDKIIQSFNPSEIIASKTHKHKIEDWFQEKFSTYFLDEWIFNYEYGREKLLDLFQVLNLKGFGIDELQNAQTASGAILHYLESTENKNLAHITSISRIKPDHFVWMDKFTIKNLEIIQSVHENGTSLYQVLDQTITPMGARLLVKWILMPLVKKNKIEERLNVVHEFLQNHEIRDSILNSLKKIGDLERLISKVPMNKINPREVFNLAESLKYLEDIKSELNNSSNERLALLSELLNPCQALKEKIFHTLIENPPINAQKGDVIKNGFNSDLDELRLLIKNNKFILEEIREREVQKTGIQNLKIGFNSVFGYYLEVTNKFKNQVPEEWIRKQTLTGAERYITQELKILEEKILTAEDKILILEQKLFEDLVNSIKNFIQPVQFNAALIGEIDCLLSFAIVAIKNNYTQPSISEGLEIKIKGGRHPVIEHQLPHGTSFVPNDIELDNEVQQILMITGPNMSGKSAVLRQTALICLMGQIGSFVPADEAEIGIVDKIFSRVGASDNISTGESTFMVEMNETASILNNISERSLILMDEIGRGTSTYDGISIAWSIVEYLHDFSKVHPKTLFATHYHELNEMSDTLERVKNFHISTLESQNKMIFLRKLKPGGSHHSFGIHVAKMAGIPPKIIHRANDILSQLEEKSLNKKKVKPLPSVQMKIFEDAGIKNLLLDLNLNNMTPIECMLKLTELKKIAEKS